MYKLFYDFSVKLYELKTENLMTAAKLWQNGRIIGEKDKSYVKFKEK